MYRKFLFLSCASLHEQKNVPQTAPANYSRVIKHLQALRNKTVQYPSIHPSILPERFIRTRHTRYPLHTWRRKSASSCTCRKPGPGRVRLRALSPNTFSATRKTAASIASAANDTRAASLDDPLLPEPTFKRDSGGHFKRGQANRRVDGSSISGRTSGDGISLVVQRRMPSFVIARIGQGFTGRLSNRPAQSWQT